MKTRIITIIVALLSLTAGHAASILIEYTTMKPGEVKDIVVTLSQYTEQYAGIQFDIKLPEGLSLVTIGSEVYYDFPSNQADDMTCNVTNTEQNAYRFMLYSNSLKLFKSGDLMTLRLKAETGIALKEYTIELNDVRLSDIDGAVTKLGNSTAIVKATDFFKLIYMVDGTEYKTVEYEYGATITPEAEPTKEGYTFSGWKDLPENMPAHDVTVTGSFTKGTYKLIYMVDGEVYKTVSYDYGAAITREAEPTKEGYTFSGWSEIPETMPGHDITVTGTFSINKYKLTYMVDGDIYKTIEYEYGATITPEANPKKEGHTFSGWDYVPTTMPANDVTVIGSFTINKYTLTYMVDGMEYKSYQFEYGANIPPETEPKKDGYTFSGWDYIPETMPAHDVTVTGTFTKNMTKGDANGDGAVNAADIVEVVNYIMGSPSAIFDNKAADVNGDGVVNAADIVEIVNIIMAAE